MVRRGLLVLLVLVSVAAGAFGMSLYKDSQEDDDDVAAATTTTLLGPTTTTTLFPLPESTTTSVGPGDTTTTTAAGGTTTTTAAGGTTTTTTARRPACGTGSAVVTFAGRNLSTTSAGSTFTPTATVENKVNQPIEVDELEYEIVYADGNRSVTFPTRGTTIPAGAASTFSVDALSTPKQYETARLVRFAYFTAGRKADCRVSI